MNAKRPTLMVVDDEPEVLRSLHDLFRKDFRVVTFTRPADALERLAKDTIPVVMSDQRMSEMTGVEFLRQAREISPDTVRLLFTGYSDIKAVVDAINQGNIFRYVYKPWEPEELAGIIRQAIDHHELIVSRRELFEELQATNAQLIEASRLKSAFIEVASHELNTPVAVILGLTELWRLQEAPQATPHQRAWNERVRGAAERLATIVERMLKLLRSEQFSTPLDVRDADLESLIQMTAGQVEPFLEARHQSLELEIDPDLGRAEVDAEKLADVLTNLLVNAIKFSPDGRAIRLRASAVGLDHVRIAVTDSGMGIGPADRKHLFEPFFTCYDTLHHSSGQFQFGKRGIGLGLHLVKTFVELHGGVIEEVRSAPGEGSTFAFTLPRQSPKLQTVRMAVE
jgi:signal transduction histidine kinase